MLNGQKNVEEGAFKGEKVKRWKDGWRPLKVKVGEVKGWKGEKVKRWLTPFEGEEVKGYFKGEKVKGWKGEKMAAPHRCTGRPNVAKKLERLVLLVLLETLENLA